MSAWVRPGSSLYAQIELYPAGRESASRLAATSHAPRMLASITAASAHRAREVPKPRA
jgi:hypothetical protein